MPFVSGPPGVFLRNNRSAISYSEFVESAILELLKNGCIAKVSSPPVVVNPLSVSIQSNGKKRLILDCRHINAFIYQEHFKLEDYKVLLDYLVPHGYMFSFDLQKGYHHLDIHIDFQQYLGFAWTFGSETLYFVYTVLPFGLSVGPWLFTKILRPLVRFFRSEGIKLVLYLDDGIVVHEDRMVAQRQALFVRDTLAQAGLSEQPEKCHWTVTQCITWLGFDINLKSFTISVPSQKLLTTRNQVNYLLTKRSVSARDLARGAGKIMSLHWFWVTCVL